MTTPETTETSGKPRFTFRFPGKPITRRRFHWREDCSIVREKYVDRKGRPAERVALENNMIELFGLEPCRRCVAAETRSEAISFEVLFHRLYNAIHFFASDSKLKLEDQTVVDARTILNALASFASLAGIRGDEFGPQIPWSYYCKLCHKEHSTTIEPPGEVWTCENEAEEEAKRGGTKVE